MEQFDKQAQLFVIAVEKGKRVSFATHVAVGAAVDRSSGPKWLTIVAAFASHIVLDTMSFAANQFGLLAYLDKKEPIAYYKVETR
jgi:hypothetical protein